MECPNCGTMNDASYRFCATCGTPLSAAQESAGPAPAEPISPTLQPAAHTASPPPPQMVPAPQYQSESEYTYPSRPQYEYGPYGASGIAALNIWGPFAGYGTRRRHVSWLMDSQGHRAAEVIQRVEAKFRQRQIPQAHLSKEMLVSRGIMVEQRPYFMLRRGLVTLALYISQFGRDLFISQASYLKPPISNFRVLLAAGMLLFQCYMFFIFPNTLQDSFSFGFSGAAISGLAQLCIVGPLGSLNFLLLSLLFLYSGYKWLKERDFLATLRVPPNEFHEDDLMAMEKAVEETVRQALTDLKLNPDDLKMATVSGTGRQLF